MHRTHVTGLVSIALAVSISSSAAAQDGDAVDLTIWDGVYTGAQAARGNAAFDVSCSRCHDTALVGSDRGPALVGDEFLSNWVDGSLEQLFTIIRDTMPPGSATTLNDDLKIDILAYILARNALPAGDGALSSDGARLDAIRVTRRGIWQGVYSEAQAVRGKGTFETTCVRCHGADLTGVTAPPLSGEVFIANWENGAVGNLFTKIRDTMPPDASTTLEPAAKLDIVAYLLERNAFPPGPTELSLDGDGLDTVQVLRKGAPPVVPNFALVQMVGCLEAGPDGRWVITSSSEPSSTRERGLAPNELQRVGRRPLGEDTYTLVSAQTFGPASRQGHKVVAKGLLYRQPDASRLNLTALETVADSCE